MIATTSPDHGGCNVLAAGGTSQHRLGLDPPPEQRVKLAESSQPNVVVMNEVEQYLRR
jgi:hypothetical protein